MSEGTTGTFTSAVQVVDGEAVTTLTLIHDEHIITWAVEELDGNDNGRRMLLHSPAMPPKEDEE